MKKLNKSVCINPTFSWVDWGLYDMTGVVAVAKDLNQYFAQCVNDWVIDIGTSGKNRVRDLMFKKMSEYEKFGAIDSEPMCHLETALEEIFTED